MDRNNIIGFALIFVVLLLWSYFNAKQTQNQLAQTRIQDSIAFIKAQDDSVMHQFLQAKDSVSSQKMVNSLPSRIFSSDSTIKPGEYSIENNLVKLSFNNIGGKITKAELKKYFKMNEVAKGPDEKSPLYLLNHPDNDWNFKLDANNLKVNSRDILFAVNQPSPGSIEFIGKTQDGRTINQSYKLEPDKYILDYTLNTPGSSLQNSKATLEWTNIIESQEKNVSYEKTRTSLHYKEAGEDSDHLKWGSSDEEKLTKPVKWVATAQQFFNTSLIADRNFENVSLKSSPFTDKGTLITQLSTVADLAVQNDQAALKMYIGPNEFSLLKAQGEQMENIVAFGASILGTVNRYVVRPVFSFLSSFISNKGLVILLLTFLVKLILFPLSYKMLHSQAKMGALKPEMAHLKEKFKDDPKQMQMESMKIYREFGVNPLGGCMPMVLQMPIWLALYQFFPASIEFRQSSFLWANDLSSYDVFAKLPFVLPFYGGHVSLFTLIWVASTLVYTFYTTKDQDFSANPAMKYMQYLMPLFFLFFFNNSASGLTAYMSFSNILNIGQTVGGKALFFPLSKMKQELHAAKAKPKKKGGFQERLESMMKEQQQKTDTKQKQIKK
ncbi:MAG: membrane protein insertase YidC [Saprospiraceae bacterium]